MKKLISLFAVLLVLVPAFAQVRVVTGTVKDSNGDPLVGAAVYEKGTTNGVITDLDGRYSISVPDNAVLTFSNISFLSQEIKLGGADFS